MPDDPEPRSPEPSRFWRGMRGLLFGEADEPTLREEIAEAIDEHEGEPAAKGDLTPTERQMLRNLLEVGDLSVGEIAVPRADMVAVPHDVGFEEFVKLVAAEGHSRFPVYGEDLDQITGMIHIRDETLAALGDAAPPFTVTDVVEPGEDGIARQVVGTYTVTSWLTGDGSPGTRFAYGGPNAAPATPDELPVATGTIEAPFVCNIGAATMAGGALTASAKERVVVAPQLSVAVTVTA